MSNRFNPGTMLGAAALLPNPHIATVSNLLSGTGGVGGGRQHGGPLSQSSGLLPQQQPQARPTDYISFRAPESRERHNMEFTRDARNRGFGQGQVDPGLAQAVQQGGESPGGK